MQQWRQHARRRALDYFLVALAAAEVVSVAVGSSIHKPATALISAVSALVLLARRRQPFAVSLVAFACLALDSEVSPTTTLAQFFGLLATFAIVGAINRPREAVIAWLLGAAVISYDEVRTAPDAGVADVLLTLAVVTMMWVAGLLVARRTSSAEAAVVRAEQAERDRHDHAVRAVAEERARIARELHDVVSHGLSVVVLQTMAARAELQDGGDPDRHLDAVEGTAREALGEMRRMLGLLQTGDLAYADVEGPAPGIDSLPGLVARATAAGLTFELAELPSSADLPRGLELSVYRVAQEALTNVVKHAPGSLVRLAISARGGEAVVSVANSAGHPTSGGPSGAGQGLIGMRQRVAVYGGSLDARRTPDGGFAVQATFPLEEPAAAAVR
ncbi:MAG: sensor histidine kinase [Angustibacter sp.]